VQVLVNEQAVDVQLEQEQTLGEVVQGLRRWLQEMNLYITELSVDETQHHLDDEAAWAERAIDEVSSIEIIALPPWEVRLNGYRVLHNYVESLADTIEHSGSAAARELLQEYAYVRQHLTEVITAVFGNGSDTSLDEAVDAARVLDSDEVDPDVDAASVVESLRRAATVVNDRIRELATPFHEARRTKQALDAVVGDVEEVSILLQTGEEHKAMQLIVRFSELVERLLRVLTAIDVRYGTDYLEKDVDSTGLRERADTLHATLEELVTAFNEQDTVLIGDVLEYDMLPQVRELFSLVPNEEIR
jgi:hypothetical protein